MTTTSEYKLIPLADVHESTHNPRRHFDGPALEQLAESIRKVGVITPATVRPKAHGFELAAGHRRYRASKLAGLTHLPCIVRTMTDQQFMEVLTIENLQREDVHPLDEAKGYEALMAAPYKMDPAKIAERVGKSVKYIYDRVKLLALSKAARALFWEGKIEAGHAILLARLPLTDQAKVIGDLPNDYRNGGLFRIEQLLYDEHAEGEGNPPIKAVSVRELADYIKRHIRFNAQEADGFLFPDTVSKIQEAAQAKTKIIEITHDYLADEDVRRVSKDKVYGERAWRRADGKEGSKTCDRSVMGVVATGAGQGEAFLVCTNKERCEVHWGAEIRAKQKREKEKAGGAAPSKKAEKPKADTWQQQQERERKARERWDAAVPAMRTALAAQVKKLPVKAGSVLASALIEQVRGYGCSKALQQMVPPGTTAEELLRHLGWLYFSRKIEHGEDYGAKTMKACGLDPKTFLAKPEKDQNAQTSAPKKAKKATARRKAA
ncbi:MAG: ParB/RepB/Spo0J family partition protein [Nitrospirota bacterium]|nr:ParB/RepB/Spo0J family partition protein [Nitrospirota bacterium]MDP3597137.1 ParB/RepB/Spo0J family partition protein [Nitrospirota bacterium]